MYKNLKICENKLLMLYYFRHDTIITDLIDKTHIKCFTD